MGKSRGRELQRSIAEKRRKKKKKAGTSAGKIDIKQNSGPFYLESL